MLDSTDRKILMLLQDNARMSNAEIARRINKAPSAVFERIRKLEEQGVILGYRAEIDPKSLGFGLTAFLQVRCDECAYQVDVAREIAGFPEVQEVHVVAGEDCYLVKARVKDTATLMRVMRERFGSMQAKAYAKTTIVLETIKETTTLPIGEE